MVKGLKYIKRATLDGIEAKYIEYTMLMKYNIKILTRKLSC
jgi:hypothetical protein